MEAHRRSLPLAVALALGIATAPVSARPPAPAALVAAVVRVPVGIVVLPALHRVVTTDASGTIDVFDAALRPLGSFRACPQARWIVADDRHGRVLVGCHDARAKPEDDRGELIIADVRARTVLTRLPGIATHTVAGIDASPRGLGYVRRSDGKVARFDPGTGRIVDVITLEGADGDRLRFVAGDARTPMIALDRDADRAFAIGNSGTPLAVALGRGRNPSDAVLDGNRLVVALSGAGTIDSIDLARPDDHRILPAVDTPIAVALGRGRQILAVGRRASEGDDLAVVAVSERGPARVVRTIPRKEDRPYPFDTTLSASDPVTRRLVVASEHNVDVVDTGSGSFSFDVGFGASITALALDATTGNAYVAMRDAPQAAIARIPVRGERPRNPSAVQDQLLRRHGEIVMSLGTTWLELENGTAATADPPGRRSPAQLVARADGSIIVSDVLSPTLGTFAAGTYREESVASSAAPRDVAYDRAGTLWFSEMTPPERGTIARRAADGRIDELSLPARVDKIAAAGDGLYWIARYPRQLLGRIARDGTIEMRSVKLQNPAFGQRELVDIAAAPGGGCYVLYDDKLVLVRPDGSADVFPNFPAGAGSRPASAVAAFADGSVAVAVDHVIVRYDRNRSRRLYWPVARETFSEPQRCRFTELTAASDGSVWGVCGERIVRVTTSGLTRTVVPPVPQSQPQSLVEARDGSMWFAEPRHSALGRIAPDGTLTEFTL